MRGFVATIRLSSKCSFVVVGVDWHCGSTMGELSQGVPGLADYTWRPAPADRRCPREEQPREEAPQSATARFQMWVTAARSEANSVSGTMGEAPASARWWLRVR